MIIRNAYVLLFEENGFVKKDICFEDGKIKQVADKIDGEYYIDATGKYITPGLIDAHSHIGICEEAIGWEGDDTCEYGNAVSPQLRAIDAINPFDIAFKEALRGGVTTVCTGPGSANVVAGTFATIKLKGNVIDEMIIDERAAMKCAFGENPRAFGKSGKEPYTRMGVAALLRKTLNDAMNYKAKKEDAEKNNKYFEKDLQMENMLLVINGDIPIKAHVHRADDICTAIRIAKEYNIGLTLDHCTEGHLIVDYLKKFDYPTIIGPSYGPKTKIETKNKTFQTAKILWDAGLKVCITTDHNVHPQESLILFAAMAAKEGLDEIEALKAITINPAEVLRIHERKGQIKKGLDADLVIWDSHPLDFMAKVEKVFIEGQEAF
ncbi:amidohydrolase [Natronincola ferrireducens]|uniref:Imidazolonepropionase n=1 Tax=Natronincola ferrireducens TaxID=393762 RepID=A0A1G8ZH54_9FIRM|nr:amidohydrolase [Natronincola ferrireducens]SDK14333.1 Imidazolonepropionase [Natronincola ferrireducens]